MSEEGFPVKGLTSSRNTSSVFQMITRSSYLSDQKTDTVSVDAVVPLSASAVATRH